MNFKRYHVSKNLWDESQYNESIEAGTIVYVPVYVGDIAAVVCSTTAPKGDNPDDVMASRIIFLLAGNVSTGAQNKVNGVSINAPRAVTPINGYVTIAYRWLDVFEPVNNWKPWNHQTMLNAGSTPLPYEPYSSEVWHDTHYIMGTDTDTITTLPAVIYANDTTATVGLKGNMSQVGTPTPTTPIQPSECGEMTDNIANLYGVDKTSLSLNFKTGDNMTIVINGTKASGANVISVAYPNITLPAGTYTVRIKMIGGTISNITGGVIFGINASTYSMRTTPQVSKVGDIGIRTFTLTEDTLLTSLDITPSYGDVGSVWDNATFECWLYSGSDDIPYEPYGYKIPISSNSTTTPVYLGEVPTTRNIQKLVLTGEEGWNKNIADASDTLYWIRVSDTAQSRCVISHLQFSGAIPTGTTIGFAIRSANNVLYFNFGADVMNAQSSGNTVAGLKEYLAAQYAAGTPVTVWYVLAEPTTAIVNEPIRKIGNYADEISSISIPTVAGANTLSIGTTLQPSEVTATYKGWHPVADAHEAENGAWT